MILVDTSVWVEHFREGSTRLKSLLLDNDVLMHPFIVGELACGNLRNREEILRLLGELPEARLAHHQEVLDLLEKQRLYGRGLGWIDAHLLASTLLSRAKIWTLDRQFSKAVAPLNVCF
jgi:hypothetical protein